MVTTPTIGPGARGDTTIGQSRTLPTLSRRLDSTDLPPEQAHYWTLQTGGFTARPETLADGRKGLVLGQWEFGRI